METKLTLQLEKKVIDKAKSYAQEHKTSLSKMVESYLDSVTNSYVEEPEITPLVESSSGVVTVPENLDIKKSIQNILMKSINEKVIAGYQYHYRFVS